MSRSRPGLADEDLRYRESNLDDPRHRRQVGDLLRDIFGFDPQGFNDVAPWPADYCAFAFLDGDRIVANVSLLPMPMIVGGRRLCAGGLQSVATRPAYRRRGLFSTLMESALAAADARYECLLLYTGLPDLYRPFGFRELQQRRFLGSLAAAAGAAAKPRSRRLDLARRSDRALVAGLFDRREPVSTHLGLEDHRVSFLLNVPWHSERRLDFLVELGTVVVHERRNSRARLIDLLCHRFPSTAAIGAALDPEAEDLEVEVMFPPDRLEGQFQDRPYCHPEGDILMARGRFAVEGTAFLLPPTAEF